MTWLFPYVELVPWVVTGGGAAALCVASVASPLPRSAKIACAALCGAVAALSAGVVIGKDVGGQRVAQLEARVEQLVKQRDTLQRLHSQQTADLIARNEANQELRKTVLTYQEELENGEVSECVADPAYNSRVQSILDTLPTD